MHSAGRMTCPGTKTQRPWWPVRCVPRTCRWPTSASPGGTPPPGQRVQAFLTPVPDDVRQSLSWVLPESVQAEIGLDTSAWVEELAGLLERIRIDLATEVDAFEERRLQAVNDRKGYLVDRYEKTINTLKKRSLINFLANRNVLPKYGFPTD